MNVVVKHISDNGKNITANTEKGKKSTIRLIITRLMISANEITLYSQENKEDSVLEYRAD